MDWKEVIEKLTEMWSVPANWDGLGAPAPDGEVIAEAYCVSSKLINRGEEAPDRVVLSPSGAIVFNWYNKEDCVEKIEVRSKQVVRHIVMNGDGDFLYYGIYDSCDKSGEGGA